MEFEWDSSKAEANEEKHGVPFTLAGAVLDDPARLIIEDRRKDYGEERFAAFGAIDGRVFALAFTWRGDCCRVISLRKANARETRRYHRQIQG
jgi:uncharacterized DUF497 family protein